LRNQLDAKPEDDVSDPLKALEDIVGKALNALNDVTTGAISREVEKPSELVIDIDFGGISLQEFAAEDNAAHTSADVPTYVEHSVDECMCLVCVISVPVIDVFLR